MKTGMRMTYSSIKDYFDKIQEASKKSPASWILVSPRVAETLNKINHKNKLKK